MKGVTTAIIMKENRVMEKQGIYPLPGMLDGEGVAGRKEK